MEAFLRTGRNSNVQIRYIYNVCKVKNMYRWSHFWVATCFRRVSGVGPGPMDGSLDSPENLPGSRMPETLQDLATRVCN